MFAVLYNILYIIIVFYSKYQIIMMFTVNVIIGL